MLGNDDQGLEKYFLILQEAVFSRIQITILSQGNHKPNLLMLLKGVPDTQIHLEIYFQKQHRRIWKDVVFKFFVSVVEYVFIFQIIKPPNQKQKLEKLLPPFQCILCYNQIFLIGTIISNAILLLTCCVTMTLGSHSGSLA